MAIVPVGAMQPLEAIDNVIEGPRVPNVPGRSGASSSDAWKCNLCDAMFSKEQGTRKGAKWFRCRLCYRAVQ
eukprot:14573360-Alexandrium_andersonii.AAC.1